MPVMTLTYTLPDEEYEAEQARRGGDYFSVLAEIVSEIRRRVKYENAGKEVQDLYDWVWRELGDRNIDPFS